MDKLIIDLLRILCPYLRAMAQKTNSPIDDIVVNIICSLIEQKK